MASVIDNDEERSPPERGQSSLCKALELLLAVGEVGMDGSGVANMSDLISRTKLPRPTAHRLLSQLKDYGLIEQAAGASAYSLGPRVLTLGAQHLQGLDLRRVALGILKGLVETTGHTAHLGIRVDNEVVFIDKVESNRGIRIASTIGQRRDLTSTSIGKALLAYLDETTIREIVGDSLPVRTRNSISTIESLLVHLAEVRKRGFALDDEEAEIGIRCAGAAIFNHDRAPVAAISVTMISSVVDRTALREIGERAAAAAKTISERLGNV